MGNHHVGVLHPGAMGAMVAAQAVAAGNVVHWLASGRSQATRDRAESAGLHAVPDLAELTRTCDLIISVCPPAAARQVAEEVAATAFSGVYLEANAISPEHVAEIAGLFSEVSAGSGSSMGGAGGAGETSGAGGVTVLDGGIVGPPPRTAGTTTLYTSGDAAAASLVRDVFADSALTVKSLDGPVGSASALKLAFASYNKISYALAAQACALAAGHGVLDDLMEIGGELLAHTPLGQADRLGGAAARAWRWAPEMREIAEACTAVGISPDLALGAAALFEKWDGHKDAADVPLDQLIGDLGDHREIGEG